MKNTTNIHMQLQAELYRAFDFFNKHFKLNMKRPVIVLGIENLEKKRGHFSHDIWVDSTNKKSENKLHEIMIAGSLLASGAYEALCTLLHEMAHQKNHILKIEDCNRTQRHNKKFQAMAEKLGMRVEHTSAQYGFATTKLTPETRELIKLKLKPNEELFKMFRLAFNELKKRKEKTPKTLTPVMIGQDTKALILAASKQMGMNQKDFTTSAVRTFAALPSRIKQVSVQLVGMTDAKEIETLLTGLLIEKHDEAKPKAN